MNEFLENFNLPPLNDPKKKEQSVQILKKNQQEVLENNQAYLAGERTWFEGINEFSHIPHDEFIATHTGLIEDAEQLNNTDIPLHEMGESLRSNLPTSYNSVSVGHISYIKHQGNCNSCVAFATMHCQEFLGSRNNVFLCC